VGQHFCCTYCAQRAAKRAKEQRGPSAVDVGQAFAKARARQRMFGGKPQYLPAAGEGLTVEAVQLYRHASLLLYWEMQMEKRSFSGGLPSELKELKL